MLYFHFDCKGYISVYTGITCRIIGKLVYEIFHSATSVEKQKHKQPTTRHKSHSLVTNETIHTHHKRSKTRLAGLKTGVYSKGMVFIE